MKKILLDFIEVITLVVKIKWGQCGIKALAWDTPLLQQRNTYIVRLLRFYVGRFTLIKIQKLRRQI